MFEVNNTIKSSKKRFTTLTKTCMKTKILLLLSLFTLLISCSKQNAYNEFVTFGEENRWQKPDVKTFEFDLTEEAQYDLTFRFSHVYDYQFATVPIHFDIEKPNGEKENFSIDIAVKDADGKELGECAGDVCDLNYKIKEKTKFSKGKYKVVVSHSFEGPYLPNVIGIGLKVERIK